MAIAVYSNPPVYTMGWRVAKSILSVSEIEQRFPNTSLTMSGSYKTGFAEARAGKDKFPLNPRNNKKWGTKAELFAEVQAWLDGTINRVDEKGRVVVPKDKGSKVAPKKAPPRAPDESFVGALKENFNEGNFKGPLGGDLGMDFKKLALWGGVALLVVVVVFALISRLTR